MRSYLSVAVVGVSLLLAGCGPDTVSASAKETQPETVVMALDTSASAKNIHEQMFNRAVEAIAAMPTSTKLIVFRFDSSPAEIHVGHPMADAAEAGKKLRPELEWKSGTRGTNLAKLFYRIDTLIADASDPVRIEIYTDCGTELMTKQDDMRAAEISEKWQGREIKVAFLGVTSGHREKLRDIVKCPMEFD